MTDPGGTENHSPKGEASSGAELKLEAIKKFILSNQPFPAKEPPEPDLDDAVLRERFLAAIFDYTDVRVVEISGVSHETIRSYRDGNWPTRGVNRKTRQGLKRFIEHHENRVTRLRWEENELPPLMSAMVLLVEEFEADQDFTKKYPNHGAIALAESAMIEFRAMGVLTYEDETTWVGFKRGRGFDPSAADAVSLADLGIRLDPFLNEPARRQVESPRD